MAIRHLSLRPGVGLIPAGTDSPPTLIPRWTRRSRRSLFANFHPQCYCNLRDRPGGPLRLHSDVLQNSPFPSRDAAQPSWGKVIDHDRCIGCHACTTACKSENEVPLSVTRTYVKYVDSGRFPNASRSFQVTRCNQCDDPPCVAACPTGAMFRRPDGIVDFDKEACIGCKACIAACPYDAVFINPEDHAAEKCNFCAHRLDVGLEPACVVVCPVGALIVGDLNDPSSKVAETASLGGIQVRRPEKGTQPKVFYKGADHLTLDPLAAARLEGDVFMWSQRRRDPAHHTPAHEGAAASSAAAILSYDVDHKAPWDYRVSLYTWTKSVASGALLLPLLLSWFAGAPVGEVMGLASPIIALVFLAATGGILLWDLDRPTKAYLIFLRPQWKSWLVRGGFIIAAYGLLLVVVLALGGLATSPPFIAITASILAAATAVYTAFLFGQAKARDLWQSPLLPFHFLAQALLAGSGAATLLALANGAPTDVYLGAFAICSLVNGLLMLGEAAMPAPTAHAKLAEREMVRGSMRLYFWTGVGASVLGVFAPLIGWPVVLAGLAGLLAQEHAYVQAGQAPPLA